MRIPDCELFKLAQGAQNNKNVKGWKTLKQFDFLAHTKSGFDATVFQRGNTTVISMPGTIPSDKRDVLNDIDIFNTKIPDQFKDAKALYYEVAKKYPSYNIEFTGYSLGGTQANLLSHYTGKPSTAFSPIGSKHIVNKYPDIFKYSDKNIKSYGVNGDKFFMNNLSRQSGQIFILPELKTRTNLSYIGEHSPLLYSTLETARLLKSGFGESHFLYNYPNLNKAKLYNPQKQYIDSQTSKRKKIPKNFQKFYGDDNFKRLEPAKLDNLKNPTIAGVANNTAVVDGTQMIVTYPKVAIAPSGSGGFLAKFGALLSGTANFLSNAVGIVTGITGNPNATKNVSSQIVGYHHTGGIVVPKYKGGRNEMIAILQGGETVRTEAQEKELQDQKMKEFMETYAPLVSGENDDNPYAQVLGNKSKKKDSKLPVLMNKTTQDEELIIAIIANAWRTNRSGFRNALRYN